MESTKRGTCRSCGSADLAELFSLGDQLVSDFPDHKPCLCVPSEAHRRAASDLLNYGPVTCAGCGGHVQLRVPITLDLCRACTLVQARHTPPPDLLYRRHYHYRSGITQTMRTALADVAEACRRAVDLRPGDVVLDIGSNDGTLLRCFGDGIITIGCEPAENLHEQGREGLDVLIRDFWSAGAFDRGLKDAMQGGPSRGNRGPGAFVGERSGDFRPKVITALGMLYDLDDPNQFIADVAKVLHPEGVFVAQLMCLRQMLRLNDVGNLAHEHLEFYTLRSLVALFARHGLEVYDVEENDVNGGSYRIFARHMPGEKYDHEGPAGPLTQIVAKALHAEKRAGLGDAAAVLEAVGVWWDDQQELLERLMQFVRHQVVNLKRTMWVYGASTKGNVLLQWWGVGPELAAAAAERDPLKVGRFTVNGVPIRGEEDFRAAAPDFALILPYAFEKEMIERERAWLQNGGQFIVPLPHPRVVRIRAKANMPGPFGGIEEVPL